MAETNNIRRYPRVMIDFNPVIPKLKKPADLTKVNIRYCVIYPFAFIHIFWDNKTSQLIYKVEEPKLTKQESEYKEEMIVAMRNMINFDSVIEKKEEALFYYIDQRFKLLAIELGMELSYDSYAKIYYYLCRDFIGFNDIDPMLRDYFVEDMECNGVDAPIFIVHRLFRNIKTTVQFTDMKLLESFVEKLAQRCKKYISYAKPILDGSLPDGSRVNATYTKDITSRGPTFTIRKFTKTPWTPPQLIGFRTLSPEMLAYLWILVEYKRNLLVVGGTASGKTTLLNAISFFIPPESRVVTIEDTRELNFARENWLPSVAREATGVGGMGEIGLFELLRASFRQNPDYVIVGEVRGKEASVLFQGMASGHSSFATIHADSIETVIKRLETPPIELPPTLLNVLDCICIMTHAVVNKNDTRKLKEVVEVVNVARDGVTTTNTPYMWSPQNDQFYFKKNSIVFEKIQKQYGLTKEELDLEFKRRIQLLFTLQQKGITEFEEVQSIINNYHRRQKETLAKFNIA